jgi:TolB-like protein
MIRKLLVLSFVSFSLSFAQKPSIAVLELEGTGINTSDLSGLSNRLRTELFKMGTYNVLERSRVDEILHEQGFQQTGCTNANCAVEVGQLIGVQYMVIGTVNKVGDFYTCDVRIVDVSSSQIVNVATKDCENCEVGNLLKSTIPDVANMLSRPGNTRDPQSDVPNTGAKTDATKPVMKKAHPTTRFCFSTNYVLEKGLDLSFGLSYLNHHYFGLNLTASEGFREKSSGVYGSAVNDFLGLGLNYSFEFHGGDICTFSPGAMLGFWKQHVGFADFYDTHIYFAGIRLPLEIGYKYVFLKPEVAFLLGTGGAYLLYSAGIAVRI